MKAEELINKCLARGSCTINGSRCPYKRECNLFQDLYFALPAKVVSMTPFQKEFVTAHVKTKFEQLTTKEVKK